MRARKRATAFDTLSVMTPQEVLTNTRSTYASCRSYQDRGDVVTVFIHEGGRRRTTSRPFQTWFVRPDLFRFEFAERDIGPESEWDRYVIWQKSGTTKSWWSITGPDEPGSLSMALAGATGVSGASAIRVPRLLLPELGGSDRVLRLETDEIVAGRPCKILVKGRAEFEEMWAIDEQTWLILRVTERHVFDKAFQERREKEMEERRPELEARGIQVPRIRHTEDFVTHTTTTYEPFLDADIPGDTFEFQPPA